MSLVKAKLVSTDGGGTITFMFNPNQLAFKRRISLTNAPGLRTERGLPKVNFAYPEPCSLSISDIMLDTYEEANSKSVLPHIRQFEKAVNFAESGTQKGKRPPTYVFVWGSNQYIRCFITELSYTLTMFLADGTPVRAKLSLSLEEIDDSIAKPSMETSATGNRESDSRASKTGASI